MKFNGVPRTVLIDTGADVTIIRDAIQGVILETSESATITGVTGEKKAIRGKQYLELEIYGNRIRHKVWVADVGCVEEGIIGMDILKKVGAVIDVGKGQVSVDVRGVQDKTDQEEKNEGIYVGLGDACLAGMNFVPGDRMTFGKSEDDVAVSSVKGESSRPLCHEFGPKVVGEATVKQGVTIPPWSEAIVCCRVSGPVGDEVLVEPVEVPVSGVRISRTVSKSRGGNVLVKAVNLSCVSVTLGRKLVVGKVFSKKFQESRDGNVRVATLTSHKKIYESLDPKMEHLPPDVRRALKGLVYKYGTLFSEIGEGKLHCTGGCGTRDTYRGCCTDS